MCCESDWPDNGQWITYDMLPSTQNLDKSNARVLGQSRGSRNGLDWEIEKSARMYDMTVMRKFKKKKS